MSDALSLLREFVIAGKEVTRDGDHLVFDGRRVPLDFPTNFKQKGKDTTYTIGSVWFLIPRIDAKAAAYIKECRLAGIVAVSQIDKRQLVSWVKGDLEQPPKSLDELNVPLLPTEDVVMGDAATAEQSLTSAGTEDQSKKRPRNSQVDSTADSGTRKKVALEPSVPGLSAPVSVAAAPFPAKAPAAVPALVAPPKRHAEPDPVLPASADVTAIKADVAATTNIEGHERPVQTRKSLLQSRGKELAPGIFDIVSTARKSFEHQKTELRNKKRLTTGAPTGQGSRGGTRLSSNANVSGGTVEGATPIIVVPAGLTSIITMYNVQDFLEHSTYVGTEEKRKAHGSSKQKSIFIKRKINTDKRGKPITKQYLVTDNTSKFTKQEWDRVVAVFVTGKEWQFKGWPMGKPVDIFTQVRGYHIILDDERQGHLTKTTLSTFNLINPNVRSWNVKVFTVSRSKRHLDAVVVGDIWEDLDKHIKRVKPYLS